MTRGRTLALGILTLLPLVVLVVAVALFAWTFTTLLSSPPPRGAGPPPQFLYLFGANCLYFAALLGLAAFYAVHVLRNPRLAPERRPLWLLVLFLGAPLSMPAYWYLHLWRDDGARGQASH